MRLIYRASEDGDTPYKFHKLCDGLSPLIVLIKTTYNKRFGGFTEAHFEASEDMIGKRSNTAFIFNLDREKAFDIIEGQNAICCHKNYLIKCEDIAKQINEYDTPKVLNEKIDILEKENEIIIKNKKDLDDKLKNDEEKINTILNLVSDLKKSFS